VRLKIGVGRLLSAIEVQGKTIMTGCLLRRASSSVVLSLEADIGMVIYGLVVRNAILKRGIALYDKPPPIAWVSTRIYTLAKHPTLKIAWAGTCQPSSFLLPIMILTRTKIRADRHLTSERTPIVHSSHATRVKVQPGGLRAELG
jgi:hypothetical protein